jgi:arylsulfatase A-like enzyme
MSGQLRGAIAVIGGGFFWGLIDSGRVLLGDRILMGFSDSSLLLVLGMLSGGLVALPGVLLMPFSTRMTQPERAGFLLGLWLPAAAALGELWFTDPPPFQKPFFTQGNPAAWLGVLVACALVAAGLYRLPRPLLSGLLVAGALTGLLLGRQSLAPRTASLGKDAPNILLVTLDTTRADHMGIYGNQQVLTEHFDRIAKEGALFTDASAVAAVTGPSHTSMFSGSGPWDHGVLLNGVPIPEDRPVLAELLYGAGYSTAAFVSAYVLDSKLGFGRGFEVYDDDFGWIRGGDRVLFARLMGMVSRHLEPDEVLERRGGDTVDLALQWMDTQDQGWFAWVHLFDAHGPYTPPPPFDTRYYEGDPRDPANTSMQQATDIAAYLKPSLEGITDLRYVLASYAGEVSYADSQLGRLLAAIDTQNTIVVVIGDHGESLGEHGVWFNHGDDVYESSVHVPFALRWPGHIPPGTRIATPFEGTDLAPTVLSLIGLVPPESMTGASAAGALISGPAFSRIEARSMCFDRKANQEERAAGRIKDPKYRMVGLRGPQSRYVQRELDGAREYFELATDPLGLDDIFELKMQTSEGREGLDILKTHAEVLFGSDATARSAMETSEEERLRLEALGYLSP